MMVHPTRSISTVVGAAELLGLTLEASQKNPEPKSDSRFGNKKPFIKNLDLTHDPEGQKKPSRRIVTKFGKIWNGRPGEINVTLHCTKLKSEARPVPLRPHRTRPKTREFVAEEIHLMWKTNISKPATGEWTSLKLIGPKHDGSYRMWNDYHKINMVTICDTYPFTRLDECIDCLRDAAVISTIDDNWGY